MGGGYGSAPGHGVPGGSYSQRYNQYTNSYGYQHRQLNEKKGKSGKGGILAAGAGGLAVSVLAMIPTKNAKYGGRPMGSPPGAGHGSVSTSDKEDLLEAREDYENTSANDKESAWDEYEEQYEETYGLGLLTLEKMKKVG
ncbi:MAG: hypothetical protein Q9204_007302 [Flavoplaca sp. TL-2023a]